jgi:hypothetical protein
VKAEYANRVHRPAPTTTAILPAISHFFRVNYSSIGLTLAQKLVTTGYTAVATPGGGTCGVAGLLIGLIGHTSEPLELAIREVGHKVILKTLSTHTEAVEEQQRGEHRLNI